MDPDSNVPDCPEPDATERWFAEVLGVAESAVVADREADTATETDVDNAAPHSVAHAGVAVGIDETGFGAGSEDAAPQVVASLRYRGLQLCRPERTTPHRLPHTA